MDRRGKTLKGAGEMIDTFRHKDHTVYMLTKRLTLFKQHTKMKFMHKGKIIWNHRFGIYPHKERRYTQWMIRLPYFYFERNNGFVNFGTPNLYISRKRKRI